MNYEQAEQDIADRLAPFVTAGVIDIVLLPQNVSDFKRPFTKGKITICYKGSKWQDPRSTAQISQEEEVMFQIEIQSRTLRGDHGIYLMKKALNQAIIGFAPTDCDRIYAKESGMTGVAETLNDGVWTYSYVVACKSISVEDYEEDLSVLLKKITNNDLTTGGSFVVESPSESFNAYELNQTL
jgi:hypothetical protein